LSKLILSIQNLSKHYGGLKAIDNISLDIPENSIFGILGPNGSGKTTTLSILLDLIKANSGSFEWMIEGSEADLRKKIGSLIETSAFYPYLSAVQNLKIVCDIKKQGYSDIENVLRTTGLLDRKNSPFKTFSLGMRQRLAIAASLIGQPKVLILDEPTNGLDPKGIAEIRELILDIANKGISILLASHLLDEVQKVCTHVAILDKGKILQQGSVEAVLADALSIEVASDNDSKLKALVSEQDWLIELSENPNFYLLKVKPGFDCIQLNRLLFKNGITAKHIRVQKKSLENYFLEITEKGQ
jgi:ABC-2 type transport system ATP-binding protein